MMVIFVEFIDQLIDYSINRASLMQYRIYLNIGRENPEHIALNPLKTRDP